MKVAKNGKTAAEIDEIEQASILHIRSISQELFSLLHGIEDLEPSMMTHTASPINRKNRSGQRTHTQFEEDDLIAFSFLKEKGREEPSRDSYQGHHPKKGSVPSVHYAGYMKPTHHMKEKIRQILLSEREQKLIAEEKQRKRVEQLKRISNRNYVQIQSRYRKYDEKRGDKAEAVANRLMEKELLQMSEVTFKPKINSNVPINQSFEERLQNCKHRKQVKEGLIIKEMVKDHTYHPKTNTHKHSESRIKKIWTNSPSGHTEKLYASQKVSKQLFSQSEGKEKRLKATAADLDFVINEALFK